MAYEYDDQNIFAKILRGEIPNDTVLETEHALAFNDINPSAEIHVLVIPKGPYVNFDHLVSEGTEAEIMGYLSAINEVCKQKGICPGEGGIGYRMISNAGESGPQDVPHLHMHVLSGRRSGWAAKGDLERETA